MDNYSYPIGSDTNLAPWNLFDVADLDFKLAAENMANAILYNNERWDEDLEHHRMDLMLDIEAILFDNRDDKLGRMRDKQYQYVSEYALYAVKYLNGFYEKWRN